MFFDSVDEILPISSKNGTSVFVLPDKTDFTIKNAFVIQPEDKASITIEQIRNLLKTLGTRQLEDRYIIIRPADQMNLEAANALLKNLEEPKDKIHYILQTSEPSRLPATILSRSAIYYLRRPHSLTEIDTEDDKVKDYAKKLLVASGTDLVHLAEEITKTKKNTRAYALEILRVAIEMLYKTYFLTNRSAFANKIPKFIKAYDSISRNGHIKLHLVADLC